MIPTPFSSANPSVDLFIFLSIIHGDISPVYTIKFYPDSTRDTSIYKTGFITGVSWKGAREDSATLVEIIEVLGG